MHAAPVGRSACCSCAPATRPARSWPSRCCASTAASDFEVYSAGTEPRGINPLTVRDLEDAGLADRRACSSKSVEEFLGQQFDYVITVCDRRASRARSSRAATRACTGATRIRPRRPARTRSGWPSSAPCSRRSACASTSSWSSPTSRERGARLPSADPMEDGSAPTDIELYLLRHAHAGNPTSGRATTPSGR